MLFVYFFFSSRRRHTRWTGDWSSDVCSSDLPTAAVRYERPRIDTTSTHGTGCTLSAAITAGLAHGRPLERAVAEALDFVARAIAQAPALGKGHGPLNHFVESRVQS